MYSATSPTVPRFICPECCGSDRRQFCNQGGILLRYRGRASPVGPFGAVSFYQRAASGRSSLASSPWTRWGPVLGRMAYWLAASVSRPPLT